MIWVRQGSSQHRSQLQSQLRNILAVFAATALITGTLLAQAAADPPPSAQQEAAAKAALARAKTAYEQGNLPAAAEQYRKFLKTHPNRPEVSTASFYLGLTLLELPQPDLQGAIDVLQGPAKNAGFPERAGALLHHGLALSTQARRLAQQAVNDPANASAHRGKSNDLSAKAIAALSAAAEAFKDNPTELVRARTLQAEALLRLDKSAEAVSVLAPLLKDATIMKSPAGRAAALTAGRAALAQNDLASSVRSLSLLAPFDEPVLSLAARLLLAEAHHAAGDLPEAAAHLDAIFSSQDKIRRALDESLKNPAGFRNRLDERFRIEATLAQFPDLIGRATYRAALVAQESNRLADAASRYTTFIQQNPKSPLIADAGLRLGICRVELKQFPEAAKVLTPLADHPSLSDQANWHLGRAKVAASQFAEAIPLLRKASEKAVAVSPNDASAKARRGEILLDLAHAQQHAGQHADASATLRSVLKEGQWPDLAESAHQRLVAALHFAGQYGESDQSAQQFQAAYPHSPNLASVLFYSAENASIPAQSAKPDAAPALYDNAIKRYHSVIGKYPEFPQVNQARFGLASAHYRLGQYPQAAAVFTTIPAAERSGPLITTPYLLADCLIRTLPENADDALAAGRLIQQGETASRLLGEFLASNSGHPLAPDALLKLGQTRLRLAGIIAEPEAKEQSIQSARQALETIVQKHPKHPVFANAVFELARGTQQLNDFNGAANQFSRFRAELKDSPIAPLALAHLADCLCRLNRAPEAVTMLAEARPRLEPALEKDAERSHYVAQLKLAHGLALNATGKFSDAVPLFNAVVTSYPSRPEAAHAKWRLAQTRKDQALADLTAARQKLSQAKPEAQAAAQAALAQAIAALSDAAAALVKQADAFTDTSAELRLQTLADAVSAYNTLRDIQLAELRSAAARAVIKKLQARRSAEVPKLQNLPPLRDPQYPVTSLPVPPAESELKATLKAVIETSPDSHHAVGASLRLVQLHSERNQHDAALAVLREANDSAPADPNIAELLKVELGYAMLTKGDAEAAARLFESVMQNVRSPHYARARLGFALNYFAQKNWPTAAQRLVRFRDKPELNNLPGITDLALLRLGQAFALTGAHEESRAALQIIIDRFGGSPHRIEARFGIAEALRHLKRHDEAVSMYQQVIQRTAGELGARAHLNTGLVRLEQKKFDDALAAFTVIPYTYDFPDISATALWEAHNALVQMEKKTDATAFLHRIVKEHPTGRWAEMAQKRLTELK